MTWIKLDDRAPRHPKIAGLSDRAFRWWIQGLCYASEFLTDGLLPRAFYAAVPPRVRAELGEAGLWVIGETVQIHDYLEHQSSRDFVLSERAFEARRAAMRRDPALRDAIQARDGNRCRYCGRPVSWSDRKGVDGATYDTVSPRGPETAENLVVACRGCHSRKQNRTPEEAGMRLLPPPKSDLDKSRSELRSESRPEIRDQRSEISTPPLPPSPSEGGYPRDKAPTRSELRRAEDIRESARGCPHRAEGDEECASREECLGRIVARLRQATWSGLRAEAS